MNLSLVAILVSSLLISRATAIVAPISEAPPPRSNPDPPGCPIELLSVSDLDMDRASGIWYMQLTNLNITPSCDGCWYESWTHNEPNALYLIACCTKDGAQTCQNNDLGSGKLSSTCVPGHYSYTMFEIGLVHNAFIVATDYDSYILYYSCGLNDDGTPYSYIYAYTRTQVPPPGFRDFINGLLDESNIQRCVLYNVVQGEGCVYRNGCGGGQNPQIEPFAMRIR